MKTAALTTSLVLAVLLGWAGPGQAAFFAETAAQTHGGAPTDPLDTDPYYGNGVFTLHGGVGTAASSVIQNFVDPVLFFGTPQREEHASAEASLGSALLRARVHGALGVSGIPGGAINVAVAGIGDTFTLTRASGPPFGTLGGDVVTFTLDLSGTFSDTPVSGGTFQGSYIGLLIAKPGTLDPGLPFQSPDYLCSFYWGIGADASVGFFQGGQIVQLPFVSKITSFPATLSASCASGDSFDWAIYIRTSFGASMVSSWDIDFSNTLLYSVTVPAGVTIESASDVLPPVVNPIYLRGSGGTANPPTPTLYLDTAAPSAATAKYKDSPAVAFAGGNKWKEVGTWTSQPAAVKGSFAALDDLVASLGLKNSDDQGTKFDLKVEAFRNGVPVADGLARCIAGVTRNPSLASFVSVPLSPLADTLVLNGSTDALSLKLSTRVGTNGDDTKCAGSHSSATGLRVYFDSTGNPSRLNAVPDDDGPI